MHLLITFWIKQKWSTTMTQVRESGCDPDRICLGLTDKLFNNILEKRNIAIFQTIKNAFLELIDTQLIDINCRGDVHSLNNLAGCSFNRAEHSFFSGSDEKYRFS